MNNDLYLVENIFYPCPKTERGMTCNFNILNDLIIIPNHKNLVVYNFRNNELLYNYKHTENISCLKLITENILVFCDTNGYCQVFDFVKKEKLFEGKIFNSSIKDIYVIGNMDICLFGGDKTSSVKIIHLNKSKTGILSSHSKTSLTGKIIESKNLIVSGGEDYEVVIYNYKNLEEIKRFNKQYGFVNCINYSLINNKLVIGSANKSIGVIDLDNLTYDNIYENCHEQGIYGIEFSSCEKFMYSISSDNSLKIWNFPQMEIFKTVKIDNDYFNNKINNSLCGMYKFEEKIYVLSLVGDIFEFNEEGNILNKRYGHSYNIINGYQINNMLVTADISGKIVEFNLDDNSKSSQKLINFKPEIFILDENNNYILTMGNKVYINNEIKEYNDKIVEIKSYDKKLFILTEKNNFYIDNELYNLPFNTNTFDIIENKVYFGLESGEVSYSNINNLLKDMNTFKCNNFEITKIKINNNLLASGDEKGFVTLWDIEKNEKITSKLNYLNSKITDLSFNKDNTLWSVTSNSSLFLVIDIQKKKKFIKVNEFHKEIINISKFIHYNNTDYVVTMGMDGMIKINKIIF